LVMRTLLCVRVSPGTSIRRYEAEYGEGSPRWSMSAEDMGSGAIGVDFTLSDGSSAEIGT
jgi:hypothetical protein